MPLLLWQACTPGKASENANDKPKSYPVIKVVEKDTSLQLHYVADIQARKNVEIHARVSGILQAIHVDEGETVKKGQLLFTINDDELQIALSKARAAFNSIAADAKVAEVEMERVQMLVTKNIVSKTELELAEAKFNAAKAKTEEAKAEVSAVLRNLSYTKVHSPFDGVINRLPLKSGSLLSNGSLLTTISDLHTMLAYFNISENEYLHLMRTNEDDSLEHNEVNLILADGTKYPYTGKLEAAESEIKENTGSIAFRADFPNPNQLLKHGATATLVIKKPSKRVLMIPQKSVIEIQDKNFVYILDENNIARMKNFRPLRRLDDYYIIKDGLKANDRIIYEGTQSIRDGEKVNPIVAKNF